ncbi:MAG: flippase-like domain-containing protein [Candidatus Daviesbacteria bacterium]|nr:MAG: flippase-like domain-containing protein [Candidatus Daviesbacteria bacterium]
MRKKIIYILIIGAFGFLIKQIFSQWSEITLSTLRFNPFNFILTIILIFLGYLLNIVSWHFLTNGLNLNISFRTNLKAWIFSSVTRFLPGKIWQYPTRVYLLSEEKIPPVAMGTAIAGEVMLNLSLGAVVVLISFLFWQLPAEISTLPLITRLKPMLLIFAMLPVLLILFANEKTIQLIGKLLSLMGKKMPDLQKIKFKPGWIMLILTIFFIRFWLWGLVLFYLANSVVNVDISLLPTFVGAFSISWLLGYISPFAPAGLGVTELSLATFLAPYLTLPVSSLVAILFRVSTLLTEGIFFLMTMLFSRIFERP